ncbi:MAG: hypothetical protein ACLP5H_33835 [Desulfomonilaceae bacterium]
MEIHVSHIKVALEVTKQEIELACGLIGEIYHAYPGSAFEGDLDELARLLGSASDCLKIFQNRGCRNDRIARQCWGNHPGCEDIQCGSCQVQSLCFEETGNRYERDLMAPEAEEHDGGT